MKYLCKWCCETLGIIFCGTAENQVNRKTCNGCGDSDDWLLHIASDADIKKLCNYTKTR